MSLNQYSSGQDDTSTPVLLHATPSLSSRTFVCWAIARWDLCVVVFGSVSSDCSHLDLYAPYALHCLLFASMVHTQHYSPPPDMLRCPPSSPSSPISGIANTPRSSNIYIYIYLLHSLSLLCLIWIHYAFYTVGSAAEEKRGSGAL
jgi:hypothetical protein